jgi:hypothetical protein
MNHFQRHAQIRLQVIFMVEDPPLRQEFLSIYFVHGAAGGPPSRP